MAVSDETEIATTNDNLAPEESVNQEPVGLEHAEQSGVTGTATIASRIDRQWTVHILRSRTFWTAVVLIVSVTVSLLRYLAEIPAAQIEEAPCNLTCREVLSAIKRAKTPLCKTELQRFGCALQNDTVYPKNLLNLCPGDKSLVQHSSSPKASAKKVRILFVLTIHGRDSRQIRRLLQLIYHTDHYYLIHVDQRSQFLFGELLQLEEILPNVKLMKERQAPIWGGASLLTALLDAIQFGLLETGWQDWDYFLNLSESDLPIKTNEELVEFLEKHYGFNFVKSHGTSPEKFVKRQGLDKSFFECENHMWRVGRREMPTGIVIDGGSDWVVLHREFCQYLLDESKSELLEGLRVVFNHTLLPAESFFHTVLHNSRYCNTYSNNNLRLTNWQRKKGCNCQYDHIVDWCGCSPNIFRLEDAKRILSYSPKPIFFARKFDPVVDLKVINIITADLRAVSTVEHRTLRLEEIPPTWRRHWVSLYSHRDEQPSELVVTLFRSLARLSAVEFSVRAIESESDREMIGNIISAHLTVDFDGRRNLTVAQEIISDQASPVTLESLVGFRDHFRVQSGGEGDIPLRRIQYLQVSTDFDQKEGIFRNYANVLGPQSDPVLAYTVSSGDPVLLSVVWLDPADVVAGSFELSVTADADVSTHQPNFKKPLRPGVWTVFLMYKWKVIARTKFLILPAASIGNNLGPDQNIYIDHNFTSVARLFPSLRPVAKKMESDENARKTARDSFSWIDSLVKAFYSVEDLCVVSPPTLPFPSCRDTHWSSFFPDDSRFFPVHS